MVVEDGDESHGTIRKRITKKKQTKYIYIVHPWKCARHHSPFFENMINFLLDDDKPLPSKNVESQDFQIVIVSGIPMDDFTIPIQNTT